MKIILRNFILFLFIIQTISEKDLCYEKSDGFYPNINCQTFYFCLNQTVNKTFQCSNSSKPIFSPYRQRCVAKNILYNECDLIDIRENLQNCAWFSIRLLGKANETIDYSCLYPYLFDLQTKECKHYSQVQCNQRFEPKDVCDYHHPQIFNSINERPCWLIPTCRNRTNDLHGNQLQDCYSYYKCKDERFISLTYCPKRMRFSDKYKTCLPSLTNCENAPIH